MKKILVILLFVFGQFSFAELLIKNNPIPGGVAVINLPETTSTPTILFGNTAILVQNVKSKASNLVHYQALVGIPLLTKVGTKTLRMIDNGVTQTLKFLLKNHQYPKQYITFKGKKKQYNKSPKSNTERIVSERKILQTARTKRSSTLLAQGGFIRPVSGITTGVFGSRRYYNNKPRRPHTGVDYAAKIGTAIIVPAKGRVILTGDFFYNGQAVFLDHGQGLVSAFIHLSEILVQQNQIIEQGEILGRVGQTGRATGPHLHWSVYLNRTAIDPSLLLL